MKSQPQLEPLKNQRIYVAGHRGMVGQALLRALDSIGAKAVICKTRDELDLCDQRAVNHFFETERPDCVLFAAAKVGGIHSNNTYPAEFIYQNLSMASNAIHAAFKNKASRFVFLGSTCIYPRMAPQPMPETCLLSGHLEKTNEAYAIAKIAGLKMCEFYRKQYGVTFHSAMPTNLYGPGDNYHSENSHVLPALIRRFHEAKQSNSSEVVIWGTGSPRREFLHVDDLASGVLHLCTLSNPPDLVNIGTGNDVTILELATQIASVVGYQGEIKTDPLRPDGTPVKRTDMNIMHSTGWNSKISLPEGLKMTYDHYLQEAQDGKLRSD